MTNSKMTDSNIQKVNIDINEDVFNEVYSYSLEDHRRTQIYFGGASAGKSAFVIGQRTVWDLLKGGRNYLILRNVARTSRTSTFNEVKQTIRDWNVEDLFHILKDTMTITCKANRCQVLFDGLDDVEKKKSIKPEVGVITDIVIEEATEVTDINTIKLLNKRLRGDWGLPKRLTLLFNPILKSHWIYKEYFHGRWDETQPCYSDDDLFILKTTYKDNKFLTEADIKDLKDETSEYHYNVYTLGNWGTLGGVIFTNWRMADLSDMHDQFTNVKNGLDFGYSADPFAFNKMHYDGMRKKIYIFHEEHEYGLTNPQIADLISPIVGKELVICDSAEPKSIKELQNCGVRAYGAEKGQKSVNHGIQFLWQHEIIIDRQCQETINEWEQYQWAKLRDGSDSDKPVDKNNHHIDDIRYALESEMANMKVTPKISFVKPDTGKELHEEKPIAKPGETIIAVWEGDKIIGYEKIRRGAVPRMGLR